MRSWPATFSTTGRGWSAWTWCSPTGSIEAWEQHAARPDAHRELGGGVRPAGRRRARWSSQHLMLGMNAHFNLDLGDRRCHGGARRGRSSRRCTPTSTASTTSWPGCVKIVGGAAHHHLPAARRGSPTCVTVEERDLRLRDDARRATSRGSWRRTWWQVAAATRRGPSIIARALTAARRRRSSPRGRCYPLGRPARAVTALGRARRTNAVGQYLVWHTVVQSRRGGVRPSASGAPALRGRAPRPNGDAALDDVDGVAHVRSALEGAFPAHLTAATRARQSCRASRQSARRRC